MKLHIYKNKQVEKTYEADAYDLMFGTIEDVAEAIDFDKLQSGSDVEIIKAVGKLVMGSKDTFKQLMKEVFDGITDDELRRTKVTEIAAVVVEVVRYTISQLSFGADEKN